MRRKAVPYLLISPTVALIAAFLVYPIASVAYYSLQHRNLTRPWADGFAGLDNFRRMLFEDEVFWHSLGFTAKWVVAEIGLQLILGLALALIVNESFIGRGLARSLVFSPWAVSGVLTTGIWILLYTPSTGVLRFLGQPEAAVLGNPGTVFPAVVVTELWRGVPFFAILLLAGLQGIPGELYEAAAVDGAGRTRRFIHVTLPHLRDAIVLATLLRGVWEFNNVDLLYTMTGGGPAQVTTTLPLYVAQRAVDSKDFGYGSALTMAGFVILLFCSILYLRLSRFGEER
ncbi:carbohydrate ABC transporter permease [Microbispora hainanensis]|uniref:Sugar ABC transporter permease n=1 Tax=Microbispora hainanensis TaxID=568844 RepID=A0A544YRG2_9ACTN|nr:sugar ABC transporter permease [Microbispora hainanensis]TQS19338.1 sugar ABC transporter permease [Microbispora hainanensis]